MANLLKRLAGPYFEFLVGPQGEWWERCHSKRRTMVLRREYYDYPNAVRVSMTVVGLAWGCFTATDPQFDFYGITELDGERLDTLIHHLAERVNAMRACKWKHEFDVLTTETFKDDCKRHLARRHQHWQHIRDQAADCLIEILQCVLSAMSTGGALLVLGA